MLEYAILFLLVAFFVMWLSYEYFERQTGVPTWPTMPAVRRRMVAMLKKEAAARPAERPFVVYDLGSGSGQLGWQIARAMPEAKVIGIELSFIPFWRSVLRQKLFGPANVEYRRVDFWPYDVSGASAVVTYLPGKIMERVGEKLRAELKPGTLILANVFYLRAGWEPVETLTMPWPFRTKLFVYRQK